MIVRQLVISARNKRTKQSGRAKTERCVYVRTHVLACVHSVTRLCVFALKQMLDFSMLDFPQIAQGGPVQYDYSINQL